MEANDPFNLRRFVDAQGHGVYERALAELRDGRKRSHWMWFIFPQHVSLGRSSTARRYGLSGVEEARAYLEHAVLGPRLLACSGAILPHLLEGVSAEDMLGPIDAMKLKSSMEIFAAARPAENRFAQVLGLLS